MKTFTQSFFLMITLLYLFSDLSLGQDSQWKGTCEVTFVGESTLHNFTGTVKTESFKVSLPSLNNTHNVKISTHVTAKAAKMDTKNAKRDAKMHEILQVAIFPDIEVAIDDLMIASTKPIIEAGIPHPTIIPFTLMIKGKEQALVGKVSDWSYTDDKISCKVSFSVSLEKSHLEVPSVLGFIKVQDNIRVVAALSLKRMPSTSDF